MIRKTILVSILFLTICSNKIFSQFIIDAELRPRFEYRNGYKRLPDEGSIAAFLVTQRTRLNLGYKYKKLGARISFQDVRVWGDEPLKTEVPGISLYEGWAEFYIADSLNIRAGRQEIIYDNERLFTNSNWPQKGMTHDAFTMNYTSNGWSGSFAAAFNQCKDTTFTTDYSGLNTNYKTLSLLWITKKWNKFKFSIMGAADGYQKKNTINTTYLRATYGGLLGFFIKNFAFDFRGYYQSGQDATGAYINAYYLNPEFTIKIKSIFTLQPGIEYQSGNNYEDTTNTQVNYFTTLYGTTHSFNGNMDYFTKPSDEKYAGLIDIYLFLKFKISNMFSLRCDYHYFSLQNNYLENHIAINRYLGSEVDLSSKISINKWLSISLGYSVMSPGSSLPIIQSGSTNKFSNWAWTMVTFKPIFLNTDNLHGTK